MLAAGGGFRRRETQKPSGCTGMIYYNSKSRDTPSETKRERAADGHDLIQFAEERKQNWTKTVSLVSIENSTRK